MLTPGELTVVSRLRLRAADRSAARLRIAQVLGGADLRPPALAPAAVLCIRRLTDPRPNRLRLDGGAVRPPADWEDAARSAIGRLAATAARPAHGAVPAGADAVLFLDRAEMLACLARDWCVGSVPTSWWWQALLRATDMSAAVLAMWRETPEQAPAAMHLLATWGRAVAFVQQVPPPGALAFARAIARTFGITDLRLAARRAGQEHDRIGRGAADDGGPRGAAAAAREPAGAIERRQPFRYAPEIVGVAAAPGQLLLAGVALTFYRAPAPERGEVVKAMVQSLFEPDEPAIGDGGAPARTRAAAAVPGSHGTPPRDRSAALAARTQNTSGDEIDSAHARSAREHATQRTGEGPLCAGDARAETESERRAEPQPAAADREPAPPVADAGQLEKPYVARPVECARETEFGGAFYLINAGIALGLYGDFTTPLSGGLSLSIWDFIALVASRVASARTRGRAAFAADPLADLLARLAGRSPVDPPGAGFRAPGEWEARADWLAPFRQPGIVTWNSRAGRLRARHPAGFLLLDVPDEPAARRRLAALLRQCSAQAGIRRGRIAQGRAKPGTLASWLDWLTPYLRARLGRALGVPAAQAGRLLLVHHARVRLSPAHLDVAFSLAGLPIAIRRAGLDRNPGFVPAAGLTITFSYD